MASNLFVHSEIVFPFDSEMELFAHSFSPFSDSAIDILEMFSDHPPSQQLESLSLYQPTHSQILDKTSANGYSDFSSIDDLEVKDEEFNLNFQPFAPHGYNGDENMATVLQKSFTSCSFDGKPGFPFQPCFDALMESANLQNPSEKLPENTFFTGQIRRVYSADDLQNLATVRTIQRSFSSPLASESSLMEESNLKVGRYSPEERKERISKYRAKRRQRNFTKTIKYACRKTLADNRPRIRGRFARDDETGDTPKAACSTRQDDEDDLWIEGWNGEEEGRTRGGGGGGGGGGEFMNMHGSLCFNYYGL